ncbi:MAG: hypothetical protein ACR2NW_09300 [Thermodesulfobacteriota bacterium]
MEIKFIIDKNCKECGGSGSVYIAERGHTFDCHSCKEKSKTNNMEKELSLEEFWQKFAFKDKKIRNPIVNWKKEIFYPKQTVLDFAKEYANMTVNQKMDILIKEMEKINQKAYTRQSPDIEIILKKIFS